jgi:hypothetical protein
MRILYRSVHAVLERDEIALFTEMGHDVFPLGAYFGHRPDSTTAPSGLRPPLRLTVAPDLMGLFDATGCELAPGGDISRVRVTADFVAAFDAVVVMHDAPFIERHWPVLAGRPVIWRTIGQNIAEYDRRLAPYRAEGMRVVRYSPVERHIPGYIGADATIRFHVEPDWFAPWHGADARALNATAGFARRYPRQYALFTRSLRALPYELAGGANEGLPHAIGRITDAGLREKLAASRAYFYCAGRNPPYALNFIEAWAAGIPVVAYDEPSWHRLPFHRPLSRRLFEVPDLLRDGVDGFVATSPRAAHARLRALLADRDHAAAIGAQGRARALQLFSKQKAWQDWQRVFGAMPDANVA